jgi:hypothetical protein
MTALELQGLLHRIQSETGHSREIDRDIGRQLGGVPSGHQSPDYTASIDACLALISRVLPGWHWHVGYGANGVFPYASVANERVRFEAQASTVPLALLTVLLEAHLSDEWT